MFIGQESIRDGNTHHHNRMNMSISVPSLSRLCSFGVTMALTSRRHSRSKSMPTRLQGHPILTDALVGLVERLEDCSTSSCFGADWLSQALQEVVNCYSNLANIDIDMQGMSSEWMNGHLDDILHLLEVCNLLREAIAEIRNHCRCVHVAIRCLGCAIAPSAHSLQRAQSSLASWPRKDKQIESQLEKCMSILRRLSEKVNVEDKAGVEGPAIDFNQAKAITIFFCSALVTTLSFKTSHIRIPFPPLPAHFTCLQNKLKEAFEIRKRSSSSRLLHELEAADIALRNLNNLLDSKSKLQLPFDISSTIVVLNDLETALPLLEHKIYQLFKFLITSRVTLLNIISSQ
ncbi:hypothetical protein SUGI_0471000 [Cryptomeria japonica]|nr:hypothetical protein SUGI_0471000 [Cryptomeria japonica]